ncbi:uncharacterized protein [Euphorbia lathyris]|uniref:uncharacterized protein isoform X2 n=1 Tax=Euphorbia lathyris TaxID=212925 RepID=UPI0033137631
MFPELRSEYRDKLALMMIILDFMTGVTTIGPLSNNHRPPYSGGVRSSASLTSALPPVSGPSRTSILSVVAQNPTSQHISEVRQSSEGHSSAVLQSSEGNSMGRGVPSNINNPQRQMPGRQPVTLQQLKQQAQNFLQYLYQELSDQNFVRQQLQLAASIHQHKVLIVQHWRFPTQQQQLMAQQPNATNMQQNHLSRQKNNVREMQQQHQRSVRQKNNLQNLQQQRDQKNLIAQNNMQHFYLSSFSGFSTSHLNILKSIRPASSLDSGQGNAVDSLQQTSVEPPQQNTVSAPLQVDQTNFFSQSWLNMHQTNIPLQSNPNMHLKQQQEQMQQQVLLQHHFNWQAKQPLPAQMVHSQQLNQPEMQQKLTKQQMLQLQQDHMVHSQQLNEHQMQQPLMKQQMFQQQQFNPQVKQPLPTQMVHSQQLSQPEMQQQQMKQQMLQQQQFNRQAKQQLPAQMVRNQEHPFLNQMAQVDQRDDVDELKIGQGTGVDPNIFQQHSSGGQNTLYTHQLMESGPSFPISSPQSLQAASPHLSQPSSPEVDQQNLLSSTTIAETQLQSANPPLTPLDLFPVAGDSEKPEYEFFPLSNAKPD